MRRHTWSRQHHIGYETASGAEPPASAVPGAGAERELPAVFSASAVTGRRGRRSREPEPSQSPSSSLGHGDRREQQQETIFTGFLVFHLLSSFSCFVILERCFDLSLSFCADPFINYDLASLFCWIYKKLFRMNEWMNLRFRPRWRGTEIWMHSGEPLSKYLARPPYLQKCRRGREPKPSRSFQQLSRLRRWQGRPSREPEPQRHIRTVAAEGILRWGGQSYLSRDSPINQQKKEMCFSR